MLGRGVHDVNTYECMPSICHVRLLSKASNTGFSRHIKPGCHLPVCITSVHHVNTYECKHTYIYIYIHT